MDVFTTAEAPEFSRRLVLRMEQKQLSIKDVAEKLNTTYEHIRKVMKGGSFPSRWLLGELCKILDLNFEEMHKLVMMDRVKIKFGKQFPILEVIADNWNELTEPQQEDIRSLVERYARYNAQNADYMRLTA